MAVVGAVATTAWATIPSASTGVIHSCYNASGNPSGSLRVIDADSGAKCSKNETALNFNQTGPQGPKGDQGIQGVKGDKGDPGTNGTNGTNGVDGVDGTNGTNGVNAASELHQASNGLNAGALSISLPAGRYFVQAVATIYNGDFGDPQDAICSLQGTVVSTHDSVPEGDFVSLPITGSVVLASPGTITVDCGGYNIRSSEKRMFVMPMTSIING